MKIYNYTVMGSLLMFLFFIAGFDVASTWVFTTLGLGNLATFTTIGFWAKVSGLFGAVAVGVAIIGSFTRTSPQFIIKATFVMPIMVLLVFDFVFILNKLVTFGQGWEYYVAAAILLPLIGGYAIALIEMWESRD